MDSQGLQVGHAVIVDIRVHGNHIQTLATQLLGMLVGSHHIGYTHMQHRWYPTGIMVNEEVLNEGI